MRASLYTADVAIVGAGPAGSIAAALLARRGYDVLLLDRATFPRDKVCGDGLTPRAVAVLERIGLLSMLQTRGYTPIQGAHIAASSGAIFGVRFAEQRLNLPDFGLVVPRFELDHLLSQHAVACGARFCPGVRVIAPLKDRGQVAGVQSVMDGHDLTVRAPLTLLATGASIGLLRSFGVLREMPPGVNAIRSYMQGIPDLRDEFEFYFDRELSPGYGWVFPLTDGQANVGIGLFGEGRDRTNRNVHRAFSEFLARHPRLATAQIVAPVKGYPLRTDYPRYPAAGPGYMLIGEAAGLVHPATGEGIDLAMESAEVAAALADATLSGTHHGKAGRSSYDNVLYHRYGNFFRGVHLLQRLAMAPNAMNLLVSKARRNPHLAHVITGINLGVISPWKAFSPRTWLDLLT